MIGRKINDLSLQRFDPCIDAELFYREGMIDILGNEDEFDMLSQCQIDCSWTQVGSGCDDSNLARFR